ncbi:sensor histidine kinase [Cohnella caldifontis]|uniref:sensor histidine kinase n=1 Tax=Cohnella caldifontis TaxID=3027471 RepID=UPI0023EC3768|nr:sensor histidine kinase [Cohnella sp. YIM B05605]
MIKRMNSFSKVVILIFGLLAIMILLFTVYTRTTVNVLEKEIESNNLNKLQFLKKELEDKVNQLSINAILLNNDPAIKELEFLTQSGDTFNRNKWNNMILDHLSLQSGASGWSTDISVYSRQTREVISTATNVLTYDDAALLRSIRRGWQFERDDGTGKSRFVWYSVTPESSYGDLEKSRLVVKTSFSTDNLKDMLDRYKADGHGEPFLFSPEYGVLGNRTMDPVFMTEIAGYLKQNAKREGGMNVPLRLGRQQMMISYLPLFGFHWYLAESIPVEQILQPVKSARNLFYAFSLALLCFGVLAAYILYRQLRIPIRELMKSMQGIKRGDYSLRIRRTGDSDFSFLYKRFNEMASEIQELLEKVYEERIRSREALLKQLQSQINPHFLYNCLFYIKNMARLGDEESVVAMALNLGEYFRYTTRLGKQTTLLREELDVIVNYLEIQNLRTKRFSYEISIPEEMKGLEIPLLILQPIVENAVIHGLEPKEGRGHIAIRGEMQDDESRIIIEDNGVGIRDDKLEQLRMKLEQPENRENASFGIWNVNQRLKLMYGEDSGLRIGRSAGGGTTVTVRIAAKKEAQ